MCQTKTQNWSSNVVGTSTVIKFQSPEYLMNPNLSRYSRTAGLYQILYIPDSDKINLPQIPVINEYTVYVGKSDYFCETSSLYHRVHKYRATLLGLTGYGNINISNKRNLHAGARKFFEDFLLADASYDNFAAYRTIIDHMYVMMAFYPGVDSWQFPIETHESVLLAEYHLKHPEQLYNTKY